MRTLALGLGLLALASPVVATAAESDAEIETRMQEAEKNLRKLYAAQQAYFQNNGVYSVRSQSLKFAPERGNRYTYYLAQRGPMQDRTRAIVDSNALNVMIVPVDRFKFPNAKAHPTSKETGCPVTPGVTPDGTTYSVGVNEAEGNHAFLILAAGHIDDDADLDCWTVASGDRKLASGKIIPAGQPYQEKSDFNPGGGSGARAAGGSGSDTVRSDITLLFAAARLWSAGRSTPLTSISQLYSADVATGTKLPKTDPWGVAYILLRAPDHVVIFSAGPDKKVGTGDEIAFVEKM